MTMMLVKVMMVMMVVTMMMTVAKVVTVMIHLGVFILRVTVACKSHLHLHHARVATAIIVGGCKSSQTYICSLPKSEIYQLYQF